MIRLYQIVLTHPELLAGFRLSGLDTHSLQRFKGEVHRLFRNQCPDLPEHQVIPIIDDLFENQGLHRRWFLKSLRGLAEHFFTWHFGQIRFRRANLLEWAENYSTRLGTMPLMAYLLGDQLYRGYITPSVINEVFSGPIVPLSDDHTLEHLWSTGLTEIHLHLNGSALLANVWEKALETRTKWVASLEQEERRREGFHKVWRLVLPNFNVADLNRLLCLAVWIRENLVAWVLGLHSGDIMAPLRMALAYPSWWVELPAAGLSLGQHPGSLLPGGRASSPIVAEGAFMAHTVSKLIAEPSNLMSQMFHVYLLIQAIVQRLFVHQHELIGFDLFDRLSGFELRDKAEEKVHRERLVQLERTGCLKALEARVSVKEDYLETLTKKIKPVVDAYGSEPNNLNFDFGLVCHFIKKPRSDGTKHFTGTHYLTCRFHSLRDSLIIQAVGLLAIRDRYQHYGRFIKGIDGAGNELHVPPEVFAPAFRLVKNNVFTRRPFPTLLSSVQPTGLDPIRFTFHAGEEFRHLLSGIRAVDETIEFLDLPPGSRIGHALAIGYDPELWFSQLPQVRISQQEWLDNLVWLYGMLPDPLRAGLGLRESIDRHAQLIYGSGRPGGYPIWLLQQAWRLRALSWANRERQLPDENELWKKCIKQSPEGVIKLAEEYHYSRHVRSRGAEVVTTAAISRNDLPNWIAAIKAVQEKMIEKINARRLAIEACPLSNLRISPLRKLSQHPIFHWHHPTREQKLWALPATDNPGIFHSSLSLEYAALGLAAESVDAEASPQQINAWLESLRDDTEKFCFITNNLDR